MEMDYIEIPLLQIQHDWYYGVVEKSKFWCSYSYEDFRSFGDVEIKENNGRKQFFSSNFKVNVNRNEDRQFFNEIEISFNPSLSPRKNYENTSVRFCRSEKEFSNLHGNKPIESIDISPHGDLGVSGSVNGMLKVWECDKGREVRSLKGHVGDVTVCKFLPSGKVVMSGSSDFQIKIWRVHDALCAVTLKGCFYGGVQSLSFIDRGRNFISSSRDGRLILWDCATQTKIRELKQMKNRSCSINDSAVLHHEHISIHQNKNNEEPLDEKEFHTENHIVSYVTQNGIMGLFDVRCSQKEVYTYQEKTKIGWNKCCLNENYAFIGGENGYINVFDLRKLQKNQSFKKMKFSTESSILDMKIYQSSSSLLLTSMRDGQTLLFDWENDNSNNRMVYSFSSSELDPVYGVKIDRTHLYSCCKDSIIRKYKLNSF